MRRSVLCWGEFLELGGLHIVRKRTGACPSESLGQGGSDGQGATN